MVISLPSAIVTFSILGSASGKRRRRVEALPLPNKVLVNKKPPMRWSLKMRSCWWRKNSIQSNKSPCTNPSLTFIRPKKRYMMRRQSNTLQISHSSRLSHPRKNMMMISRHQRSFWISPLLSAWSRKLVCSPPFRWSSSLQMTYSFMKKLRVRYPKS